MARRRRRDPRLDRLPRRLPEVRLRAANRPEQEPKGRRRGRRVRPETLVALVRVRTRGWLRRVHDGRVLPRDGPPLARSDGVGGWAGARLCRSRRVCRRRDRAPRRQEPHRSTGHVRVLRRGRRRSPATQRHVADVPEVRTRGRRPGQGERVLSRRRHSGDDHRRRRAAPRRRRDSEHHSTSSSWTRARCGSSCTASSTRVTSRTTHTYANLVSSGGGQRSNRRDPGATVMRDRLRAVGAGRRGARLRRVGQGRGVRARGGGFERGGDGGRPSGRARETHEDHGADLRRGSRGNDRRQARVSERGGGFPRGSLWGPGRSGAGRTAALRPGSRRASGRGPSTAAS